jgi:hypothetical protein
MHAWPLWIRPSELQATLVWAALVGCIGVCSQSRFARHTGSLEETAAQLVWWKPPRTVKRE